MWKSRLFEVKIQYLLWLRVWKQDQLSDKEFFSDIVHKGLKKQKRFSNQGEDFMVPKGPYS